MTTSNAAGQLVFNIGPGVTIPFLGNLREPEHGGTDRQVSQTPTPVILSTEIASAAETHMVVKSEENKPHVRSPPGELEIPTSADTVLPEQQASIVDTAAPASVKARIASAPLVEEVAIADRTVRQPETTADPSMSNLALQLVNLSARNLASGVCVAATETYSMAQRVAEVTNDLILKSYTQCYRTYLVVIQLGLQQFNDHLQRRGIHFDDKEKEDLKAILLMLLIVICAIFLLGMGKQRISNHWDFYFPN